MPSPFALSVVDLLAHLRPTGLLLQTKYARLHRARRDLSTPAGYHNIRALFSSSSHPSIASHDFRICLDIVVSAFTMCAIMLVLHGTSMKIN